jgi:hypothetical protein
MSGFCSGHNINAQAGQVASHCPPTRPTSLLDRAGMAGQCQTSNRGSTELHPQSSYHCDACSKGWCSNNRAPIAGDTPLAGSMGVQKNTPPPPAAAPRSSTPGCALEDKRRRASFQDNQGHRAPAPAFSNPARAGLLQRTCLHGAARVAASLSSLAARPCLCSAPPAGRRTSAGLASVGC